jgi:hypothetical protein
MSPRSTERIYFYVLMVINLMFSYLDVSIYFYVLRRSGDYEEITSGSLDRSGPGRVVGGGQNWELETRAHNVQQLENHSRYSIDRRRSFLETSRYR